MRRGYSVSIILDDFLAVLTNFDKNEPKITFRVVSPLQRTGIIDKLCARDSGDFISVILLS